MKKFIKYIAIPVLAALALTACKDEDNYVKSTGVSIDKTSLELTVGETYQLKATISPDNATSQAKSWYSDDSKIAEVNDEGVVTAIAPGTTKIHIKTVAFQWTAACDVVVNPVKVKGISLNKTSIKLLLGETETLVATLDPANATEQGITWTSSDESIAKVEAGVVTAIRPGEATITATTKDGGYKATCKVESTLEIPTEPQTLNLWKDNTEGYLGIFGGSTPQTVDFISYNGKGVVSWSANTSGKPRTATMEFSTGSKITITQFEMKDLAGNYTFYNYSFKSTDVSETKIVNQAGRKHETSVQFKVVENPQTINGHSHNLDLVGLFLDFAVPASFEIVDGTPVLYTYLSLDYQKVSSGAEVACIPELTNSTSYKTGYFAPLSFGVDNCNYVWVAWGVDDFFGTPKFGLGTGAQRLVSNGLYCCGFSFVTKGYASGVYTTIYQFNYNNKWEYAGASGAAYFEKK